MSINRPVHDPDIYLALLEHWPGSLNDDATVNLEEREPCGRESQ